MASSYGLNPFFAKFRSPFGDVLGFFGSAQGSYRCRELELNVLDCTDVYGHKGIMKQCKDAYDDFAECVYEVKQRARVDEMQKERMRQYLNGERSKKDLYAEPPKLDSYYKTYGKTID